MVDISSKEYIALKGITKIVELVEKLVTQLLYQLMNLGDTLFRNWNWASSSFERNLSRVICHFMSYTFTSMCSEPQQQLLVFLWLLLRALVQVLQADVFPVPSSEGSARAL